MVSRSLSRELALLVLGQDSESNKRPKNAADLPFEALLEKALDSLNQHWRETLDSSASDLEQAQQKLADSRIESETGASLRSVASAQDCLNDSLSNAERVLNGLSACLELPRLLLLADQEQIRRGATERVQLVIDQRSSIDHQLDQVMEGWRLTRLPRIDRDILRLAVVDLKSLGTPAPVAFNEAVELAHRYSDEQGRRMINGVLRRFHDQPQPAGS